MAKQTKTTEALPSDLEVIAQNAVDQLIRIDGLNADVNRLQQKLKKQTDELNGTKKRLEETLNEAKQQKEANSNLKNDNARMKEEIEGLKKKIEEAGP